ncbi:MAG: hypothetical protein Q9221_007554 [Calogaya cf. arnoldii]
MAVQNKFSQRIRAAKAVSDDENSTTSLSDEDVELAGPAEEDEDTASIEKHSDGEATSEEADAASISFGALAKAQESLSKRIYHPRGLHLTDITQPYKNEEAIERKAGKSDNRDHLRSSKHAPVELSSKKAVSRKREVVPTPKREVRDPRFETVSGPVNEEKANRNYSFLNDYRDSEIVHLKSRIRQEKDATAKEYLKRSLLSMESRKKAQQIKDQDSEIQKAHRAKEKELVKQGKRPFYLKKGEQKKLALLKRFEGIKGKRLDKVIERRRKKNAQKERRDMPEERRLVNG